MHHPYENPKGKKTTIKTCKQECKQEWLFTEGERERERESQREREIVGGGVFGIRWVGGVFGIRWVGGVCGGARDIVVEVGYEAGEMLGIQM